MATRPEQGPGGRGFAQAQSEDCPNISLFQVCRTPWIVHASCPVGVGMSLPVTGSDQAYWTISTGRLSALLRVHPRPIDVVVCHGPQGDLVLRGASRLDAFSGYPVRS